MTWADAPVIATIVVAALYLGAADLVVAGMTEIDPAMSADPATLPTWTVTLYAKQIQTQRVPRWWTPLLAVDGQWKALRLPVVAKTAFDAIEVAKALVDGKVTAQGAGRDLPWPHWTAMLADEPHPGLPRVA